MDISSLQICLFRPHMHYVCAILVIVVTGFLVPVMSIPVGKSYFQFIKSLKVSRIWLIALDVRKSQFVKYWGFTWVPDLQVLSWLIGYYFTLMKYVSISDKLTQLLRVHEGWSINTGCEEMWRAAVRSVSCLRGWGEHTCQVVSPGSIGSALH